MQSIDPRGSENIQRASGTSARAQTTRTPAPADPLSRFAEPPLMLPNDPGTRNTFEALNEDTSDLGFNLDSLPYLKLENHTKARLIIEDFLDIKSKGLRDYELYMLEKENEKLRRQNNAIARDFDDLRNLTITKDVQQRKKRIEEATRHKEELEAAKAARQSSRRSSRDSLSSLIFDLVRSKPKAKIKPTEERENRKGSEWNKHGRRRGGHGSPTKREENGPPKDLRFGNEPLKDLGQDLERGYEPLGGPRPNRPLTSTPFSTRVIAKHTYGILRAFNDDRDDFFELRAADLHLRAKELALFARSFLKELNECFEKLAKELKGIQSSLRLGLKDDKSLADKLYSACKNVLKTTIARINLASTFTAAVANIRRAIGFATESIQPLKSESYRPSKASRAYASFSEPFDQSQHSSQHSSQTSSKADSDDLEDEYECFIQGCQYGGEHFKGSSLVNQGSRATKHASLSLSQVKGPSQPACKPSI
ncbi:hypothetical protein MBM_08926 [Drepanopeziza brunnea f. sp. 'multigermtubi' MB_m1]|uniref:Uncharacterized protein n=1 Tax=Marssonina brunnea f. sp. multigermtubi (strain MB_m1) TaxID=1072389 RepID=K1WL34_MARBU|nr:uncharacterized protein MBM_08926 [Drepanopeziza brunnea f. sp. 'multigermtubi' MB_m1]EKD12972.1 hypothetical protein MBM_08926 [Drepanopeziza brunnea f. sp. 'multigermtubi' MB_m1]